MKTKPEKRSQFVWSSVALVISALMAAILSQLTFHDFGVSVRVLCVVLVLGFLVQAYLLAQQFFGPRTLLAAGIGLIVSVASLFPLVELLFQHTAGQTIGNMYLQFVERIYSRVVKGDLLAYDWVLIGVGVLLILSSVYLARTQYYSRETKNIIRTEIIRIQPISSFFKPEIKEEDKGDPKYIEDGRGFWISIEFEVYTYDKRVTINSATTSGWQNGLSFLSTLLEIYKDGGAVSHDGNYRFQPKIAMEPDSVLSLRVRRKYYSPFQGKGAPFDFRNAEIQLNLEYVCDAELTKDTYYFKTNYNTNGLNVIKKLSGISYLHDNHVRAACTKGHISATERDLVLTINPELRIRALEGDHHDDMARYQNTNVTPHQFEILESIERSIGV